VDFHPGAGVGAHDYKVANLAAWAAWETLFVLERIGTHLGHEKDWRQKLFEVHGLASLKQAAFILFLCLG